MNIYEFVLSKGKLSDVHRAELKTKRGFTDETIEKYRFISGGEYLLGIEEELRKLFLEDDLLKSGVFAFNKVTATTSLSPMLLKDLIIIPYLRGQDVVLLRPHKLGLRDVQIEVYETTWSDNMMIIAESEFKAVAASQLGFAAIGIPGVGSFSKEHFPRLVKLLNDHKVRCCCIIFDSECKDNPKYRNYKPNPSERYDTEYFAYYMAYLLDKEGKDVRIGTLPEGWRVEGKIDIDGALARGKTKEEFQYIIAASKTYRQYREDLPKEAQLVIQRKLDKKYYRSHIRIEFGCYVATRGSGKKEHDEELSNFTVRIIAVHDTSEGLIREVVFTNKHGETSRNFSLSAADMMCDSFRTFCLSVGNYIWKGRQEDISTLWEMSFLDSEDTRTIVEPDCVGWLEDEKMWLFGNVAINKDGQEMRPDEHGIFWTDKKGIKPVGSVVTTGRNTINSGVPALNLYKFDIREFRTRLADTIGENQSNLCLGWVNACFFMEDVFKLHSCFPFLFLRGLKGSGKTKIATWLLSFFGIEGEGYQIEGTTQVAAGRFLSYYSSLPVLFDDYRNIEKVQIKDGFFRNVYNRQSAGKGTKDGFTIREVRIRGTALFTGEETPHDGALMERCVPIWVSEKRRAKDHLRWYATNRLNFSYHAYDLLKRKKELFPVYMRILDEAFDYFVSHKCASRVAVNYAVVVAGYACYFGEKDVEFAKWVSAETDRTAMENKSENQTAIFFEDLLALKIKNRIKDDLWQVEGEYIYIYLHGLYNEWADDYRRRRGEPPFKESAIRDYLKDEPGFVEMSKDKRIKENSLSCMVFGLEDTPKTLKTIVGVSEYAPRGVGADTPTVNLI